MAESVYLREVVETDLLFFFEYQSDPISNEMANFPARDHDAFYDLWRNKILSKETTIARTIVFGKIVAGDLVSWEDKDKRMIGYWLDRKLWGKGIATNALAQFLKVVKSRPLYASVAKHNKGSIRVLEKNGFAFEEPLELFILNN